MPGPASVRPGDVVTAMNGLEVEVTNTDGEGRMVMADLQRVQKWKLEFILIVEIQKNVFEIKFHFLNALYSTTLPLNSSQNTSSIWRP